MSAVELTKLSTEERHQLVSVPINGQGLKTLLEAGMVWLKTNQQIVNRLNVFPVQIAPLCERMDDIPHLALHFAKRISRKMNLRAPELTEANIMDLQNYDWPGNVRELENAIERAIILSRQGKIQFNLTREAGSDGQFLQPRFQLEGATNRSDSVWSLQEFRQFERQNAINALKQCNWKISGRNSASELLGLNPTTLVERMKRWRIKKP